LGAVADRLAHLEGDVGVTKNGHKAPRRDRTLEELRRIAKMQAQRLVSPPPKLRLRELFEQLDAGDMS
jgi:hypothetical protein